MYFWLPILSAVSLATLISLWPSRRRTPERGHPLPPGPTPVPIVGNVLGINLTEPWVSYTRWGKIYGRFLSRILVRPSNLEYPGDLVYTRLLNQEVIVINSEEVAKDLLERRSYNYSDRPAIIRMTNDL
jgi:hypothetical protein